MSETETRTLAERPNDVTLFYAVGGQLGKRINEYKELQDRAKGCKVKGSGSTGKFNDGWWDGNDRVTVTRKFTIDMDGPAYEVQHMIDDLESFAGGRTTVDIDVSASVIGQPPKITDSGMVIPRGPVREYEEHEKDHTATVTVTTDLTDFMAGEN